MSRAKASPSGNPRAGDVANAPVVHTGRAPRVPAGLGDAGREVWRAVWAAGDGAYHPQTDRWVIARYCELHDRRVALLALVERDGLTVVGSTGQTVMHPALRHVENTEREMRAIESVLGLSLEARLRLGIAANTVKRSTLDDLLGGLDD
ncbi:phage terminase small subunit P27 family [Crossiella sp. CA198]|uniref:phage terminase small subunit P27 family n=1 Tax=Crossiella sp. CA198 TaxID=3455607 RepID=UPI003F8D51E8